MTRKQLEDIAQEIRCDKKPVKMSEREFFNAIDCYRRTSGNLEFVKRFLNDNQLSIYPEKLDSINFDDEIRLSYKYQIKHNCFQLYSLKIDKYKNLVDFYVNFESTNNYATFIGLNGSGKSNVLEAISAIFYSLYYLATVGGKNHQCEFNYTISYILGGNYYEIENGKEFSLGKVTLNILPRNIIASYSGEDTRLWNRFFKPVYDRYCSRMLSDNQGFIPPFMFYISKYQWEISMLVLLYSEDIDVNIFKSEIIGNKKCRISFEYLNKNLSKWEGTDVHAFIEKLKEKKNYTIDEFKEIVNNISFIEQSSTLFYLLYKCTVTDEYKLISKINIDFENEGNLDGLSEGEKKLILSNTIINVLSNENSLCLFDEPDSHIHLSKKSDLIKLIDSTNRYSIVTTHSSVFSSQMEFENLKYINRGKLENSDYIKALNNISGGEISYIEGAFIASSRNIVVVEGSYDIKYIKKAIQIFGQKETKYYRLNQLSYVPQGSADNTENFFNDIIAGMHGNANTILYIFDFDRPGRTASGKIREFKKSHPKLQYIFYQLSYNNEYVEGTDPDYYIEDLFSEDSYIDIVKEIQSKNKYCEFKCNNQGETHKRIKTHIEKNYSNNFKDEYFIKFKPLLDTVLSVFNL